ncbi:MAG TPA: DinB family protein [Anaerolineales bacterium]
MSENILVKLFEHNNWANRQIIQACSALSDEQLDAEPQSSTKGSIRATLLHFVASQRGYLSLLTLPVEERPTVPPAFSELQESARTSGEGFVALARDEAGKSLKTQLETRDGYFVEPWVVMVQAINHATEHREQIKSMLSALGVTPPDIDGWDYGLVTNALIPISADGN